MMMRMLEAGGVEALIDGIRTADEDNPNGYYEFEAVKSTRDDRSWLDRAEGRAVKMVYSLVCDLPADRQYEVLLMRREMAEVMASQQAMLERNGQKSLVADKRMAALFANELKRFEAWVSDQTNMRVLDVGYNELVVNSRIQIAAIGVFLDRTLDEMAMSDVIDPSLYRQRAA